jgi:two-component system, cell cycle sensor histidine kinase PleC
MASVEHSLFETLPYASLVLRVGADDDLTLELCNRAAAELYGINPGNVAGKQLHHLFIEKMADFIQKSGLRCLAEKKTIVTEAEVLLPMTSARQSFTLIPVFDKKGRITYIHTIALPFEADKLELQKERDHALMLMTSAFDTSTLGIFVTDRERKILRVNEAFLRDFGFRRRDIIGYDFTHIFVPADRRAATKTYRDFLSGQSEARHEWRIRAGAKEADVLVTTALLHLNQDRPLVVHTFVDISDHKHLEESLRLAKEQADSANRSKSAFLASMSHELRTPLNAILGFSELIKNETFGPVGHPKYREYLGDIHFAATHLLEIINDVLDMSKIEAGKFELVESDVDVKGLFESVIRLMNDRAAAQNITITIDVAQDVEAIHADKRVLRQMLFNLLSNAIKFSYPNGAITVVAEQDRRSKNILLSVRDQGRGIAPEEIDRMMEPFNQGQASVNDGTGTGLGLPLTRAMAELHGGTLTIDSKPNKGTCVTIVLPPERLLPPNRARNLKRTG